MASVLRDLYDRLAWLPRYPAFAEAPATFAARAVRFTLAEHFRGDGTVEFAACGGRRFGTPRNNISSFVTAVFGQRDLNIVRFWRRALARGSVFVDVGANIGLYTVPASECVGPEGGVLAFEANPRTFRYLEDNLARNRVDNVWAENLAVGAMEGELRIASTAANPGEAHMALDGEAGDPVPVVTLDAYAAAHGLERVDYIKIDVEGFEAAVLQGARGLLDANPAILVQTEYEPRHLARYGDPRAMADLLQSHGFFAHAISWRDGAAQPIRSLADHQGEIVWSRYRLPA